jgi:hypothetical protein
VELTTIITAIAKISSRADLTPLKQRRHEYGTSKITQKETSRIKETRCQEDPRQENPTKQD